MILRPARSDEAQLLTDLALRSKAHWGYDNAFLELARVELTLAADEIVPRRATVADEDGRILGFSTLEGAPPEAELGFLFIDPAAIGQGVGRVLWALAVATARGLGFARIVLDADPNAEGFYAAMGAVRISAVPSGSVPGRVLPRMAFEL
ncbi:GNAT family N-acetyltransferase [Longispora sp. K20-0274]|uniref:GNAT family N-acetyltransferase n=1 Tax=Longispora sp. K20-0274 TaxID=3088255 RepID=UPI0039996E54